MSSLVNYNEKELKMPKLLHDLATKLQKQGYSQSKAWAVATSALQKAGDLKKGSNKLTPKGQKASAKHALKIKKGK